MHPEHAEVVIVGGGIMGCGLAYHLALEGLTDVVLLEKSELTSGSTWHAAGQITHSTSSYTIGRCVGYNVSLYSDRLEADTGQNVTWHGTGSLRLAYTDDEVDWLLQSLSVGTGLGHSMEIVGPERIRQLHPFYRLNGIQAALHTPDDGHVDPSGVTLAFAKGARQRGVQIARECRATNIRRTRIGEWQVQTEYSKITCRHVVNAAGTYARQVAEWSGYDLPATSLTHHYVVTEPVPEFEVLETELPVVRDDKQVSGYIRMEQVSGLIGIYEKSNPNSVWESGCPWRVENELFEPDLERIMPWLENALERMPILANLGIRRTVHGAISHPPDGNPLIGRAPGLRNYWCCCGTQIGIGWGPSLTRELARLIVHGDADLNMRDFDPRRFGSYADQAYQIAKAKEDYVLRHEIPFPHFNRTAARPVRPSPLYNDLKNRGAVFEEVCGHERPRWFANNGSTPKDIYSFRRSELHKIVGDEVRAVNSGAGIMDISAFAKIEVDGKSARGFLNSICPNRIPSRDGRFCLTHILNPNGRIQLETTVFRFSETRFYLVCAAFYEFTLLDILNHSNKGSDIQVINRTDEWGALAINGPCSRRILSQATIAHLDDESFEFLTAKRIKVAGLPLWAFRMSYAGELGWELHGPRDNILSAFLALEDAGRNFGLANYGSFAMNSMRLEKGFKGASELTNEVTLPEAGLMKFAQMDKDFVGRSTTLSTMNSSLRWKCLLLELEDDGYSDGNGGEAIVSKGRKVGAITSVAYGHRVGKLLAFAYVQPQFAANEFELQACVMGKLRRASVLHEPPFDPQGRLPRVQN